MKSPGDEDRIGCDGAPTMGVVRNPCVWRSAVNPFVEHHQQSVRFQYSCFDRMLLSAVVQPMQQPARIVGFLDKCRQVPSITRASFRSVEQPIGQQALVLLIQLNAVAACCVWGGDSKANLRRCVITRTSC